MQKIAQLKVRDLTNEQYKAELDATTAKDCLCEGLGVAALIKDQMPLQHKLSAVTICPGPNLAYFSGVFSLAEMVDHIYGRKNILNSLYRPNMFVNELRLYIDYLKEKIDTGIARTPKQEKYLQTFKANLLSGIAYYKELAAHLKNESKMYIAQMQEELQQAFNSLNVDRVCELQIREELIHS